MKRQTAYPHVVLLYGLAAFCTLGSINTLVSTKYEADEARVFVEMNKGLTEKQKRQRVEELEEYDQLLTANWYLWVAGAVIATSGATGILINRYRKSANI